MTDAPRPATDVFDESSFREPVPMPNPTPEMLADPLFEAIWQTIKSWDVNVPESYQGYCGANGSHVAMIFNCVHSTDAPRPVTAESEVSRLTAELEEARSVITFYAWKDNWVVVPAGWLLAPALQDHGAMARSYIERTAK